MLIFNYFSMQKWVMRKCVPNEDWPINASHCWDYSYYWWHISRQNLKMIPHPLPSHLDDSAQVEELLIVYMLLKSATSSCRANVRGPPPTGKSGSRQSCLVSTAAGDGLLSKKNVSGHWPYEWKNVFAASTTHGKDNTKKSCVKKEELSQNNTRCSRRKFVKMDQVYTEIHSFERNGEKQKRK